MRETKLFRSHSGKWGDISYRSDTEKGETNVSNQTAGDGDKTFQIRQWEMKTNVSDQTVGDGDKTFPIR